MIRVAPMLAPWLLAVALLGCQDEARKQLYFPDLTPPLGVGKVTVLSDVNMNLDTGGECTVITVVQPDVDRDELDRLMSSFFRQVKDRRGFKKGDAAARIDLRFYVNEGQAKAGGKDWLAQVLYSGGEPTLTNRQKAPILKWAKKALGNQPEFSGSLKPQLLADPQALSLEITIPFVSDDGSGKYVEKLSSVKALTEFVSYTRTLFDKIGELKKLTFIGKHNDAVVMKIWLTREQYNELDLRQVEESLGAFQGQFIELILSKQISEKAVEAKVIKERRRVYRETLARLPKEQVELAKTLQ